jgi:hypothetical protein
MMRTWETRGVGGGGGGAEQLLCPLKEAAHSICKNVTFITTHNQKQWRRKGRKVRSVLPDGTLLQSLRPTRLLGLRRRLSIVKEN